MWAGEAAAAIEDLERAARHARTLGRPPAGDRESPLRPDLPRCTARSRSRPAWSVRSRCAGRSRATTGSRSTVMRARALFEAMRGNFDVARELIAAALALAEQLGLEVDASGAQSDAAEIELLAGRLAEAERVLRLSRRRPRAQGRRGPPRHGGAAARGCALSAGPVRRSHAADRAGGAIGAGRRPRPAGRLAARAGEAARAAGRFRATPIASRARRSRWPREPTTSTCTRARSRISSRSSAWPDARRRRWTSSSPRSASTTRKAMSSRRRGRVR